MSIKPARIRAVVVAVLVLAFVIPWTYAHIAYAWPWKEQSTGEACTGKYYLTPYDKQRSIFLGILSDGRKVRMSSRGEVSMGRDTASFTTRNASGSTSQAASIIEAVEAGSTALLLDEDTSATNLLIRDSRMRELVAAEREPITPLVDRITALFRRRGVSTVMVMGGSGDYLDVADRVLLMDAYHLRDVTEQARRVVADQPRPLTGLED